jgi:hypothetical protein
VRLGTLPVGSEELAREAHSLKGTSGSFGLRAVPKTHAVICRSNRAPVMNSAASKVMVRDIAVLPS